MRGQRREGRIPSVEPELRSGCQIDVTFYPQILAKSRQGADGVVAALFERAIDAHQDRLGVGSEVGPIALAVLANDHGRPNRTLGMVVVKRNMVIVQECEQVGFVAS